MRGPNDLLILAKIMVAPVALALLIGALLVVVFGQSERSVNALAEQFREVTPTITRINAESVEHMLGMVEAMAADPIIGPEPDALHAILVNLRRYSAIESAHFLDAGEAVLASGVGTDSLAALGSPLPESARIALSPEERFFGERDGRLVYSFPFVFQDEYLGRLQVILTLAEIRAIGEGVVAQATNISAASEQTMLRIAWGAAALIVLSLVVAFAISNAITARLRSLNVAAQAIGQGDLTAAVIPSSRDEVGLLQRSFLKLTNELKQLLLGLKQGSSTLVSNSSQIQATAQQSAAAAEQQASTVTEVRSTTEELRRTSESTTHNAQAVMKASEEAMARSKNGMSVIQQAIEVIDLTIEKVEQTAERVVDVTARNKQIAEIIQSVEEISVRSSVLALNASIEATKAGEAGRGFAVVATEVRALAANSKSATDRIQTILNDVQKANNSAVASTEESTRRARDSRVAIESVHEVIADLDTTLADNSEKAQQIAAAATQQSAGIEQIAAAMSAVSQVGNENVQGARALEKSSQDLTDLAKTLAQMTAGYTLESR